MLKFSSILAAAVMAVASSASAVDVMPTVTHIEVTPATVDIEIGDTVEFTATAYFDDGGSMGMDVTDMSMWGDSYGSIYGGLGKAAAAVRIPAAGFIGAGMYVAYMPGTVSIWAEYYDDVLAKAAGVTVPMPAGYTDTATVNVYYADTDTMTVDSTDTLVECDNADLDMNFMALTGSGSIEVIMYSGIFPPHLPEGNPVQKYYSITAGAGIGGFQVELVFYYSPDDLLNSDISDPATLYCAYYDTVAGVWVPVASTVDTVNMTVTCVTTHFSLWSLGGEGAALPVSLTGFSAVPGAAGIELAWSTACEIDNLGWNVYRVNGGAAVKVNGRLIAGAGTTSEPQYYTLADASGTAGSTYRLEQVDTDGTSETVAETSVSAVSGIVDYVNNDACRIVLNGSQEVTFTVSGINGRSVSSETARFGSGPVTLAMPAVPADGVYIVTVNGNAFSSVRKVFITK